MQTVSEPIKRLRKKLEESLDSTPQRVSVFFKTGLGDYAHHDKFMGISVPTLRKIAKDFFSLTMQELSLLMLSPFNEERLLALIIITEQYKTGNPEQKEERYNWYLSHLNYVNNWNLVDSSAHHILGAHLFEQDCSSLETLAASKNLWERRIAIVSTLYFIRKSLFNVTFKIATLLFNDSHDLIHKAVGWMLREVGKKDEMQLVTFLSLHAPQMPKTMLRYATERLTPAQKRMLSSSSIK